jgi:hypothetical protein
MSDTVKIGIGLAVFVVLVTSPLWWSAVSGGEMQPPVLEKAAYGDDCVEPAEYMRAYHMDLLNEWRDRVVRDNERVYVAADQARYDMSLSHTCLDCHQDKGEFCDKCHNFMAVDPYCWDCHVEPNGSS